MKIQILFTIPIPSTELSEDATLAEDGIGGFVIEYRYTENNVKKSGKICIYKVAALRKYNESCSPLLPIQAAYDKLVEVQDSEWCKEIVSKIMSHRRLGSDYHHYMIYLDSVRSFEFIALSWDVSTENL